MPAPALAAPADRSLFRGYRFPPEVIAHAVWLYFRFHLSLRNVQDLLAERGLVVSHESIRQWCDTFGPTFAAGLRKRRARPMSSGLTGSASVEASASTGPTWTRTSAL